MQIRDIVNRDIVNLTNCEHEPIHIPGSIQPHGFLWALTLPHFSIDYCSGNCIDFIQLSHTQLLGKQVDEVLDADEARRVKDFVAAGQMMTGPHTLTIAGKTFNCAAHNNGTNLVLEFEPPGEVSMAVTDVYLQTRQFTNYMQSAETLQSLCQAVATETRSITGYDRVMIYKFDEAYNGEVFAEACRSDIEPFFGLHYPHTDIPAQARELYIKNLLRLISDVNYTPVPIYTVDDGKDKNLDLGLSVLRSVSPIHVQYLHNMGVGATLTISLIHQGKLWGLIACHHYSPKYINMHTRIAAQLQGHFLTSQIPVRQQAEEYAIAQKVNGALDELLRQVFSSHNLVLQQLVQQPEMLRVTNAQGVIMVVDNEVHCAGKVPAIEKIKELVNWLNLNSPPTGFHTHKLVGVYPEGNHCADVSGVIFHPLGGSQHNCIIWCRPEALQEVTWAGDPQKAIEKDNNGLSPRKSFEGWKEVKKCESMAWMKPEIMAAGNFASALQKHVHMVFLSKEELKQRQLSEKLKEANDELENINWIGSHDLKEPLRKIQMFASKILSDEEVHATSSVVKSVKKMNDSADRMQSLIKDVLSYSRLSHIEEGVVPVDLNQVLAAVLDDLSFELEESASMVQVGILPVIEGIPFLLHQLFTNLLRNSIKFARNEEAPLIKIAVQQTELPEVFNTTGDYYKISVQDNGIGFDNEKKEAIFKVFTRLHNSESYQGTGIGLALCRKIMSNHNGFIVADGKEGQGAIFHLYFPIGNRMVPAQ